MNEKIDVLVIGGGTGGVAAAWAAARNGMRTALLEETDWLGGQLTSQGVSCADAHQYIEDCCTASFRAYRAGVRDYYRLGYRLSAAGRAMKYLNPGNGWVSSLCHEPKAGVAAIDQLLRPAIDNGCLSVYSNTVVTGVDAKDGHVRAVRARCMTGSKQAWLSFEPKYVIEAGELGDFLEMAGVPYSLGMESRDDTGEEHAYYGKPDPTHVQSFTFCFGVEFCPGGDHTIPKPARYEHYRDSQPFGLEGFPFFTQTPGGKPPFWTYRRLIDHTLFDDPRLPNDIATINWMSNDYYGGDIVGASAAKRKLLLEDAKGLSLAFLYWLQTECPREDGNGNGYPEIKLRADVMDTSDGLSKYPYIREGRRIHALKTIVESDVIATSNPLARAKLHDDTVGIGWYMIDIHKCAGGEKPGEDLGGQPTKPFQIPLGALIPRNGGNLLAGAKNLGVTHITNGAYRLHPIEWNTGESAATLAALCIETGMTPAEVYNDRALLRQLQRRLVLQGVPLTWYTDLPPDHPLFIGAQRLAVEAGWIADPDSLLFEPQKELTDQDRAALKKLGVDAGTAKTRGDVALEFGRTEPPDAGLK